LTEKMRFEYTDLHLKLIKGPPEFVSNLTSIIICTDHINKTP